MHKNPPVANYRLVALICCALLIHPVNSLMWAQQEQAPPPNQQGPNQPPPAQPLSPEQIDSLVAPVALYPDPLLSQVLVACTYPLELVQADRWLQQNRGLQGQALTTAAQTQSWDPSIQALVVFPDVIKRLDENLKWTTDLGNAFLEQQQDVMDAVQRLRQRANDKGALQSNEQQRVAVVPDNGRQVIEIQPASPQVIYVPAYNPVMIWGAPPVYYPYPPIYYPPPPPGWVIGAAIGTAIFFGVAIGVGAYYRGWGGWGGWGWGFGWGNRTIVVNNNFYHRYGYQPSGFYSHTVGREAWVHDPIHRDGVPYRNAAVASRFGGGNFRPDARAGAYRPGPAARPAPDFNRGGQRPLDNRSAQPNRLPAARPNVSSPNRVGSRDVAPATHDHGNTPFGHVEQGDRTGVAASRGRASMDSRSSSPQPRTQSAPAPQTHQGAPAAHSAPARSNESGKKR